MASKKSKKSTDKFLKTIKKHKLYKTVTKNSRFIALTALVLALGIGGFFLAQKYRGLVIAAVVNKTPITRWQLNQTLANRYGQPVLDELVNNELLSQQASKEGIKIDQAKIQQELDSLAERFGGADSLDTIREQYGLSKDQLNEQIRLRLVQEKLAAKLFDVQVEEQEVKDYFEQNSSAFADKSLEEVKGQIKETLLNQKMQQEFSAWFEKVKQEAQIKTYIN